MPVVELLLDMGQLGDRPTGTISGFGERLAALIFALGECGRPSDDLGGMLAATGEGTGLVRVVERLALGLQTLVGDRAAWGETRGAGAAGSCLVAYGYAQEEVGLLAGRLAVRLVGALAAGDETAVADPGAVVEELERVAERVGYGPSTGAIVAEAARRGIPVSRPDRGRAFVLLGHGHHQRRLWATATDGTSLVAAYTAGDKELTGRLLRDAGIPTPSGGAVADADEAARLAARLGFPVVVKPLDGNHGAASPSDWRTWTPCAPPSPPPPARARPDEPWSSARWRAGTTACWSSATGWWRRPSGSPPTSSATAGGRSASWCPRPTPTPAAASVTAAR
jgi:cyanophycin synthetase